MTKKSIAVIGLLALTACSTTRFQSSTNGYLDRAHSEILPPAKIFVVENPMTDNALLEAEVAHYVGRILREQGFDVVQYADDADVLVFTLYGIGAPREVSSINPVYVPEKTTAIKSATGMTVGSATSPASVAYIPGSRTVHDRWLVIGAYDYRTLSEDEEVVEIWRGETTSSGSSGDLRYVLPYLLVPALEHFGRNTGKAVKATVRSGDARVEALLAPTSVK
jgi:hypothetical protein